MPAGRLCALYKPLVFVVAVRTSLVALFLIATFAAGTTAPDWSNTRTDRVAPASWALEVGLAIMTASVQRLGTLCRDSVDTGFSAGAGLARRQSIGVRNAG